MIKKKDREIDQLRKELESNRLDNSRKLDEIREELNEKEEARIELSEEIEELNLKIASYEE